MKCAPVLATSLCVLFITIASARAAHAELIQDGGIWLMGLGQGSFERVDPRLSKLRWWFDGQVRFFDDTDGLGQTIVRPGLGWAVTEDLVVWLGYAWIRDYPPGLDDVDENRIWQQATWSHTFGRLAFSSRSRLEERFVESGDDVGWRYRQLVKLMVPMPFLERLSVVGYDEIFLNFNDTDWGANAGFDQNRFFAGLNMAIDPQGHIRGEIGYLNRFVYEEYGDDRMDNLLSINFYLTY